MTSLYYIMDGDGNVLEETDPLTWGYWMAGADRTTKRTEIMSGVVVSTVFLGIDHGLMGSTKPVLWETMPIDMEAQDHLACWDEAMLRYTSMEEAQRGHLWVCNVIRKAMTAALEFYRLPKDDRGRLREYVLGYWEGAMEHCEWTQQQPTVEPLGVRHIRLGAGHQ